MAGPEPNPKKLDAFGSHMDDDAMSIYDQDPPATDAAPAAAAASPQPELKSKIKESEQTLTLPIDAQDNYFERREPAELVFCIILAAAYAGLARYLWEPLQESRHWQHFISVEGFFITLSLLSLTLGLRPYLSPSSLQISNHGIKYRGPYWPQRKTINWSQMFKLYLSPDLVIVLYRPPTNPRGIRLLFIQCNYLSDPKRIVERFSKYTPVSPTYLKSPEWYIKTIFLIGYLSVVCWILYMLRG